MTTTEPETTIPDPIDLDRQEEARLAAALGTGAPGAAGAAGATPDRSTPAEYAGFEMVGIPDRPPQTEREAEMYLAGRGRDAAQHGPAHPSTHGVMRLVVKIRSEMVTDLDVVLGYLHRGIEKLCENATYTTVLTYVDPMDYMSAMHNEHAPAIAFEKLTASRRRPAPSTSAGGRLNRVDSHGLMMGFLALDMVGPDPILYGFINRDEVVDLLSSISGQRMLFNFFRVAA